MTSEQLGLVAQIAPVFLLLLVAERVGFTRTENTMGARRWKTALLCAGVVLWMDCMTALVLAGRDRGEWASWVVMISFALAAGTVVGAGLALFTLATEDD